MDAERQEHLRTLDRLIASKARKAERVCRELRALVRQREQLVSDTPETEDTDVTKARTDHAYA